MTDVAAARAPWRVVAVDDEPPALLALQQALATAPQFVLVATTTDPLHAAATIREARADVVFLDIQMPGLTGFDVARALDDPLPLIVFVTAYHEHALAAFDVHAVDYVLKPIDPARFTRTLASVEQRLRDQRASTLLPQLRAVLQHLEQESLRPATAMTRIPVRVDGRTLLLDPATIDRVESDNNTLTWYVGRERHQSRATLTQAAELLPAAQFVRVHRSVIVNLARVRAVEPYVNGEYVIHLADGARILTGRTFRETVRSVFRLGST